ncbi:unnamed protein product [Zymoseptoria tritici ST99CH_1A5]|uniref:Uncharacterized protein n=3 Tax=Zymoseptoria tritici TaxID=1047171 RepID=F9XH19_ZYMTI|nr:uncharacterized protein MYCGRDRAFT_95403 [Zymoseptoria tritici IPO323]EGP85136.1 hypothetical protein MYCGRDRAFT_95403 [Zymoseptoria tritici IPO323]SMQ53667.1 unnamed protein product [Zymoseptoria tritici ST99CH_3D7]SMY27304.1 unnamed protein product [Zymoseptoria tritici ST99CH_1A5]
MYNVDSLPPSYYEERLLADQAARLAKQQTQQKQHLADHTARLSAHLPHCTAQKSSMPCPQSLTFALSQQRPSMSRVPSSSGGGGGGVLGGIFQGFVKVRKEEGRWSGASTSGTCTPTAKETSPVTTPGVGGGMREDGRMTREEYDAWHRGRKRDCEVGAMPAFYH